MKSLVISGLVFAASANASAIQFIECKVSSGTIKVAKDLTTSKMTWFETANGSATTTPANVSCEDFKQESLPSDESTTNLLKMMNIDPKNVAGMVSVDCMYGEIGNRLTQFNSKDGKRLGVVIFTTNLLVMPLICQ
ncbi:MAG TPA: hypothetical protein VN132_10475 [Bdellovibrio sp.]|nr:hypothetical protein [Bdellovibrio sp.]